MAEKGTSRKSVGPKPRHRESQPSVCTAERMQSVTCLYDCFSACSFVRISSRGLMTIADPTGTHTTENTSVPLRQKDFKLHNYPTFIVIAPAHLWQQLRPIEEPCLHSLPSWPSSKSATDHSTWNRSPWLELPLHCATQKRKLTQSDIYCR